MNKIGRPKKPEILKFNYEKEMKKIERQKKRMQKELEKVNKLNERLLKRIERNKTKQEKKQKSEDKKKQKSEDKEKKKYLKSVSQLFDLTKQTKKQNIDLKKKLNDNKAILLSNVDKKVKKTLRNENKELRNKIKENKETLKREYHRKRGIHYECEVLFFQQTTEEGYDKAKPKYRFKRSQKLKSLTLNFL